MSAPFLNKLKRATFFVALLLAISACNNNTVEEFGNAETIEAELSNAETLTLFHKDSITAFYEDRSYEPAWENDRIRRNFIETLQNSEREGLSFTDYHGEEIVEKEERLKELDETDLSRLDILLTDAFFRFGNHLLNGKTNPRELHEIYDVPRNDVSIKDLLEDAIANDNIEDAIEELRPPHLIYHQLMASLEEYRELSEDFEGFEDIPEGETIDHDEEDDRLPLIQSRLEFFGYLNSVDSTNTRNDEDVQNAIKEFQEDNGIESDGIIGNGTITMLNKGYDERYDQILLNLERWRWYPRDLGDHYILVNIADYGLHVVKDGDTVRSHRTMVGTEARKTPIFSEEIEYLVFNPTWTIPPTIQNKDVIPGMQNNPDYLSNKNIKVRDSNGEEVDPSSIDWEDEEAKSYTYSQDAGSSNPLGRVKIMYPNDYLIYLHDTPSQSLFEQNSRAESSGCVRVEDAIDLAKYLLNDQDEYSSSDIDEIIESGSTTQINMEQKVDVHHFYWTAWRENGRTVFAEDIYGYDIKTLEALKKA